MAMHQRTADSRTGASVAIPSSTDGEWLAPLERPPLRLVERVGVGHPPSGAIVHGENLRVLQAVSSSLSNSIRCVYIDPPYNNQESYRYYDDRLDHDEWLGEMEARLDAIVPLLTLDGSVWISVDDSEIHHLKVAADRVFQRRNFVTTIVWQQRTTRENRRVFSNNHEYILVYARDLSEFARFRNPLPPSPELMLRYRNPDGDPRGSWQSVSANVQDGHATDSQYYDLVGPSGRVHRPPPGRCWVYSRDRMEREIKAGNVWFGKDGDGVPRLKRFMDTRAGLTPHTLWLASEVGTTDEAKKQIVRLFPDRPVFDTPKPEGLVARVLEIASDPDDLVLDAYLGSGTTAAVAHKLGRRYIGIEREGTAVSLSRERLRLVVTGEQSGISERCGWVGGGGYAVYRGPGRE